MLAAVDKHDTWLRFKESLEARDDQVAANPLPGYSKVTKREQIRFVSASTPHADKWLSTPPDTSFAGTIVSDEFVLGLQRRTGLMLAAYVPVIKTALEAGEDVDYFGDSLDGCANHTRQHDAVVRAWYDAKTAVAEGPVVS